MKLVGRAALIVLAFAVMLAMSSCDQTFRPIATPILSPGADPGPLHHAIIVDNNGGGIGATDNLDTSGDTNTGIIITGANPVHAALLLGNGAVYVANKGGDSLTTYQTFFPQNGSLVVSLAPGSQPVFVNTTQGNAVFVAEAGTGKVAAVNSASNVVVGETVNLGGTPVALAETPSQAKLYVVLSNSNVFDLTPGDFTAPLPPAIVVGASPAWAVASSDSAFIFVVNQGGNSVSVISTATDTVVQTIAVGPSPNFAKYDPHLKRVYVTNSGGNTVSVIDASGTVPFPAAVNVTVGNAPTSVTALADGSRAYVANSGSGTVSVINAGSLTVSKTITVGTTPISLDSSPDSTRVIVANRDTVNSGSAIVGSISDITTVTDSVVTTFLPARSNPTFVIVTQ